MRAVKLKHVHVHALTVVKCTHSKVGYQSTLGRNTATRAQGRDICHVINVNLGK